MNAKKNVDMSENLIEKNERERGFSPERTKENNIGISHSLNIDKEKLSLRVYERFCKFGMSKNVNNKPSTPKQIKQGCFIDGFRFAKFCKDAGILDRNITTTEVDIVFNKFKTNKERRISYDKFLEGISCLLEKKHQDLCKEAIREKTLDVILACSEPSIVSNSSDDINNTKRLSLQPNVFVESGRRTSVFERLTDPSKYTGVHRRRSLA